MPITMTCPSCSKLLSAPEAAVGKRAQCPECGKIMIVPAAILQAEPMSDNVVSPSSNQSAGYSDGTGGTGPESRSASSGADGQQRRPCPECGKMIAAAAAKCRFCDAIFDPRLRAPATGRCRSAMARPPSGLSGYVLHLRFIGHH